MERENKMEINHKLNKCNPNLALATWYPRMPCILVKDFQRKSLIKEDYLEETLGFL